MERCWVPIAEAGVRGCLDRGKKRLNLAFDKCPRFAFSPRKSLGLDFPGRIHGQHSFFGEPGKQHPDGGHVLFDRGRRGLTLEDSIYAATVMGSISSRCW